jgi:hypothetical protein
LIVRAASVAFRCRCVTANDVDRLAKTIGSDQDTAVPVGGAKAVTDTEVVPAGSSRLTNATGTDDGDTDVALSAKTVTDRVAGSAFLDLVTAGADGCGARFVDRADHVRRTGTTTFFRRRCRIAGDIRFPHTTAESTDILAKFLCLIASAVTFRCG